MIYIPYGLTNSIPIIYTSEVLVHRETYTGILIVIIFVIASQIPSNSRITSVQFSRSVVSDSLQPHGCLPVHNQLPEFTQTHIHWVSDAIQPSHPLSSPSPPALNLSQHQGLFKCVGFSYQLAKVLELQLQHQSFQWIFRTDFLEDGLVGSPCSPRDSQESSPTPQFKSINSLAVSFLYSPALTAIHDYWRNHCLD